MYIPILYEIRSLLYLRDLTHELSLHTRDNEFCLTVQC